jgi:hypothetical protein
MGLITWVVIAIVILAIIGLGWQTFFSGVWQGAQKVGQNPLVQNLTREVKDKVGDTIPDSTK